VDSSTIFERLFTAALIGAPDGGGLMAYNYLSGEPITELHEGRPDRVRSTSWTARSSPTVTWKQPSVTQLTLPASMPSSSEQSPRCRWKGRPSSTPDELELQVGSSDRARGIR
jgi:hypothetical protein